MERELGDQTHDDPVRGRQERHIPVPVGGLQGDPRVYRRLHLSEHAQQGLQPATQPGSIP